MATEVETLLLRLEATQSRFEKQMKAAYNSADRNSKKIERRFAKMNKSIGGSFNALQGVMIKAFAAAAAARGAQQLIDSATRIENALKVAGLAGEELTSVYNELFASAQKNAAPIEALVTLYGRAALVQKELGISQQELLGFTDKVALSLRVSGKSAAESSGALLQLSQALGSGVVRAEEFNSILEGALPIAQAAAAGLEEAGGSVSKLRQLVVDGKVSSEAFFRAFEAGSVILEQKVAGAELTVAQHFTRLQNVLVDTAGKFDDATGASKVLGGAISSITGYVAAAGTALDTFNAGPLADFIKDASSGATAASNLVEKLTGLPALLGAAKLAGQVMSDAMMGRSPGSSVQTTAADARLAASNAALEAALAAKYGTPKTTPKTNRLPGKPKIKPVSLDDYELPSKPGKGRGGSKRQNEFAREVEQIKERTAALQIEMQVMSGLNPLVNDYGYSLEKARASQELLQAAQRAGVAITPELKAQINTLAEAYAQAGVNVDKLAEKQKGVADAAAFFGDAMSGALDDLIPKIETGNQALDNFVNTLIQAVSQAALLGKGPLASLFGGGIGAGRSGGLLGGAIIPGILHSGGVAGSDGYGHGRAVSPSVFAGAKRYHQGGIAGLQPGEIPTILKKGEPVLPSIGALKEIAGGGGSTYAPVYNIDARGADQAAINRLEAGLAQRDRTFQKRVASGARTRETRGTRP